MTELEKQKCYKAMWAGIVNGREAQEVFKQTNISELQMRFADQKTGYAQGTYHVLTCIGYKHPDMEILYDLL